MLHGSGERGNDNEKQLTHGASMFLEEKLRKEYPAIIVFPQCAESDYWSNVVINSGKENYPIFNFKENGNPTNAMKTLQLLVRYILDEYPVDTNRIYIGGLSMGGMGAFEIVRRNPTLFAAAFPICGGAHVNTAPGLIYTDWWIFHGMKDEVVPHEFSIKMEEAIKKATGNVKLTLYPGAGHDSWTAAFAEPKLLFWLFSKKLND